MSKTSRFSISLLLVGALALAAAAAYVHWKGGQAIAGGSPEFVIAPGTGMAAVARALTAQGLIDEPYTMLAWAYAKDYTGKLRAGEYRIETGITLKQLLEQFVRGEVIQYNLTFVEGWNFRQILAALGRAPKLRRVLSSNEPVAVMQALNKPGVHPEGRFFPDTYVYAAGTTDLGILAQAWAAMERTLKSEWGQRGSGLAIKTAEEALVLASIIEKETGQASERELISGVFHNRLRKGMRLQTDPTVIYGLGDAFDGNLTRRHLRTDTPYNTYTRAGLPPTPIAMPGREAIRAALHPETTRALYFVARGDGSHQFSETLAQHNQAVARYQLKRAGAGRSKP